MDACHAAEQPQGAGVDNAARSVAAAGFFFAVLSFIILMIAALYWCYKRRAQKDDSESNLELAERGFSNQSIGDNNSFPTTADPQRPPKTNPSREMPNPESEFEEIDLSTPPTGIRTAGPITHKPLPNLPSLSSLNSTARASEAAPATPSNKQPSLPSVPSSSDQINSGVHINGNFEVGSASSSSDDSSLEQSHSDAGLKDASLTTTNNEQLSLLGASSSSDQGRGTGAQLDSKAPSGQDPSNEGPAPTGTSEEQRENTSAKQ
ncbi:hypothetical protein RRF57_000830 [Xylaria bambusicola]|uniref:Uncharacterized protein n=1 Tax=Xylaria bambusicola TaxID=326684 RepID=A0AAN7UPD7_9PEZI